MSSLVVRTAALIAASLFVAPITPLAQTFAAPTATDPVIMTVVPEAGRMKATAPKHADENLLFGRVRGGVYTVDGMVAKLHLNYDVNGVRYLYLFVPGVGTALVSTTADADAVTAKAKLQENELSFTAGEHHFKLTGVALATSKGNVPEHLYVKLDRTAWNLNRRPMVGFGSSEAMPYQWPGALSAAAAEAEAPSEQGSLAPPVPVSLLPSTRTVTPQASASTSVSPVALRPVSLP